MISNASIWIVRYLAPVLFLTSVFLSVFSFVGPVPQFHSSVSLVTVSPMNITAGKGLGSRALFDLGVTGGRRVPREASIATVLSARSTVDGPTILFGPLGSCAKPSNNGKLVCTTASWHAAYDLSVLPDNAPKSALSPSIPITSSVFYLVALILSLLFFCLSIIGSLADILPSAPKPIVQLNNHAVATKIIASFGMLGFIIGLLSSIVWRVTFGMDVSEFNSRIATANGNPALVASLSNGFTMMWVAYAFQGPLLICALFKLHMLAVPAAKA